jgi:hypothetical protein
MGDFSLIGIEKNNSLSFDQNDEGVFKFLKK